MITIEIDHAQFVSEAEVYGQSLSMQRQLGYLAVEAPGSSEMERVKELAFADFETAITEMLKTDAELCGFLDIDNERTHHIVNGRSVANDGTPMVEMLRIGAELSKRAAEEDPAYESQAIRDACDVEAAEKVDSLKPGQTFIGISFDPKKALAEHPEIYKDKFGYRKGLIYIQTYSKVDEQTLEVGSYSVDESDREVLCELMVEVMGMDIPRGVSDDEWLKHGQIIEANPEAAKSLALNARAGFYERIGKSDERLSASQYVKQNEVFVRQLFDIYYPSLAEAVYTGQNNLILQGLAGSLLSQNIANLKAKVRHQLTHAAISEKFDDETGRMFNSVIRYAVVEQLRKGFKRFADEEIRQVPSHSFYFIQSAPITTQEAHYILAANVEAGVMAGRSYGGCPGQIELSDINNNSILGQNEPSRQEAYGGAGQDMKCVTCPFCKKTVDAKVTTTHISCPECKASVKRK